MSLSGVCPVCGTDVPCAEDVIPSEILTCADCFTPVVVESLEVGKVLLAPAPKVEEDWGE